MDRFHLSCILKCIVPVELTCHNERAVGIGGEILGVGSNLLSEELYSGRQVPCNGCNADGLVDSKELSCGDDKCLLGKKQNLNNAIQANNEFIPVKRPAQTWKQTAPTW